MIQNYLKTIKFSRVGEIGIGKLNAIEGCKKEIKHTKKLLWLWSGMLLLVLTYMYACNSPIAEHIQMYIKPYSMLHYGLDNKEVLAVWTDYFSSNKINNLNVNEIIARKFYLSIFVFVLIIAIIVKKTFHKSEIQNEELEDKYEIDYFIYTLFMISSGILLLDAITPISSNNKVELLAKLIGTEITESFVLLYFFMHINALIKFLITLTIASMLSLGIQKYRLNNEIKNKTRELERLGLDRYNFSKEALLSDINKKKQKSKEYEDAILMSKELMLNIIDRDKSKHSVLENQALDRLTQETLERARKTDKELVELHFNANKMMIND